jgi:hypothetical protein
MMSVEEFSTVIEGLIKKEGTLETINISGGEPTLHPEFLSFLDMAKRPEIARVSVSTNGILLSRDPALCRTLAERNVYVSLQIDGLDISVAEQLRGNRSLPEVKAKALKNLAAAGTQTTLVFTAAGNVNEHQIGETVRLLLSQESILSLMIQPVSYIRRNDREFLPADPLNRLTIPDIVKHIVEQSDGLLIEQDFVPLPCSHPSCFALTYLLSLGDGTFIPFPRFVDFERYVAMLANRGTVRPDAEMESALQQTIDDLWSGAHQVPDSERILRSLKDTLKRLFPEGRALEVKERLKRGEGTVKTIFIHSFMDHYTFDLERLRKCCTHYALPNGKMMPACAYNLFYRERDPRFTTANQK